jgi:hypothetical protein
MFKLGLNAKLMRGATGATGTTLVKNIKDLAVSLTKATADATTRAAEGWEVFLATLKSASLTFNMLYDPEDSDFVVFLNAFLGNEGLSLFVTDGEGSGIDADWDVSKFDWNQALREGQEFSVELVLMASERAPTWVDGTASSDGGSEASNS